MEKIERTTMTKFEMMTMKIETTTTKVRGHDGKDWKNEDYNRGDED